jgi:hypothetical protein
MRHALFVAPIAALLTACASPVPVAENFPLTYQRVARSAQHWDVVAADVGQQTSAMLNSHPALKGRPVFVGDGYRSTAFNVAFRNFLTNHMVRNGLPVNVCRAGRVTQGGFVAEPAEVSVQYEAQLVEHATVPHYRPGMLTALAAGVVVGRALAVSHFDGTEASIIGLGLAALADVGLGHVARPTRTELIITTTIAEQNRYIMRRSDVYYVPDGDAFLFVSHYSHPSPCATVAGLPRTAEDARAEMYATSMRRSNPLWRP